MAGLFVGSFEVSLQLLEALPFGVQCLSSDEVLILLLLDLGLGPSSLAGDLHHVG